MTTVTPFLMFEGRAHEAMTRYVAAVPGSEVLRLELADGEGSDGAGRVTLGEVSLAGQRVRCFDTPTPHAFSFTPAVSLFVTVATPSELDAIVERLAVGGTFLMPADNYGFSERFAWFNDEYGVSWQVNVEPEVSA
jgi:predicted 3-demethylubiquinone-9 3-methyltransferase (glyoxalase superfamily)